ncbi:multidrug resistance protein 3 [Aspergillus similis]
MDKDTVHVLENQLKGLPARGPRRRTVFSFATPLDYAIISISCFAAIVAGGLNPLLTVLYGQLVSSFDQFQNGTISGATLQSHISRFTLYYVYLGIGLFVSVYITTVGFYYTGERITRTLRRQYLRTIISQNMAFFDTLGAGELTTRITSDITQIQEAITGNLSVSLTAAATFVSAYVIAFVEYWKLALILTSTVIVLSVTGAVGVALPVKWTLQSQALESSGATVAEEAISAIAHVTAFGIQERLVQKYDDHLKPAERPGLKAGFVTALMIGMVNAIPYLSYGLSFWEGSRLLVGGEMSISGVTTSTLAIVIGAWAVGRVAPNAKSFISSIAATSTILDAIARKSPQDPFSDGGEHLEIGGLDISFRDIQLIYPSRPEVTVLHKLNLIVPAFKTTALVGASGCGKSSIIGLLERFYAPTNGEILIGDRNIQLLNLNRLRSQIALVSQEPILFNTTIFENIVYGLAEQSASLTSQQLQHLVEGAARAANAHEFISGLPRGYQTEVGEKGSRLSGGQRQRICIARAMSAPNSQYKALTAASQGRTTIIIAHRLSTVRDADNIVVMADGCIAEQGTHEVLMARNGHYAELVRKQQVSSDLAHGPGDIDDPSSLEPEAEMLLDKESAFDHHYDHRPKTEVKEKGMASVATDAPKPADSASPKSSWNGLGNTIKLIGTLSRPEMVLTGIATILAVVAGISVPAQSIIFAKLIDAFSLAPEIKLRQQVNFWSLMYLALGLGILIVWLCHGVIFAYTTEKLVHRARKQCFGHILRQEVGFFQLEQNSTGALMSLLSSAPTDLKGLSGPVLGAILTFLATIVGGVVLSLIIGWKLALVCTATIPLVAGFGWVRLAMLSLFAEKMKRTQQESASYASEAVSAIRTVASLTMEKQVLHCYDTIIFSKSRESVRSILQASAFYALSQSITFLCAALAFWYGGTLLSSHEYTVVQFFICFAALISGAQTAGVIFSYAPGMSKAMEAARDLQSLFSSRPTIDTWDSAQIPFDKKACTGRIEFRDVSFSYPSHPERLVIDRFSLTIQPGQFVAFVGASGCEKSTLIALLERFFDPISGQIAIDGQDIATINVADYRYTISLVGQEPILFSGTIRDNLLLGTMDSVSDEEMTFLLTTLVSNGFATELGSKGVMLSGGQKQRLAIARALIRNTKILLLDEATAALDSRSEAMVLKSLCKAAEKRTTIAVAHRLSTIQHADLICVLEAGRVQRGVYTGMVEMQNRGTANPPVL